MLVAVKYHDALVASRKYTTERYTRSLELPNAKPRRMNLRAPARSIVQQGTDPTTPDVPPRTLSSINHA